MAIVARQLSLFDEDTRFCKRCESRQLLTNFRPHSTHPGKYISWCRDCERKASRERYEAKRHILLLQARQYKRAHRQQAQAYQQEYRHRFPEKLADVQRRAHVRHGERNRARVKRWAADNPDRVKEQHRKRKARTRRAPGTFSECDWQRLKARYDWRCLRCGKQESTDGIVLHADHVIPLVRGGWNIISNIEPLCGFCNNSKGTRMRDYRPDFWQT